MMVTVIGHVTLDGVVQAFARPDEDSRGGFRHGGWSVPYVDAAVMAAWREGIAKTTPTGVIAATYRPERGRRFWADCSEIPNVP
jgi:hypothetical protein